MILRPVDQTGDILPILSSADRLSGAAATALLIEYRLKLYQGEWWETPSQGFWILERFRDARITAQTAPALASEIAAYIRDTPGVLSVTDLQLTQASRAFTLTCTVTTEEGSIPIQYTGSW